tara:strand:+ start:399 stop:2291 length:1893 start_codon:yes stop_codon:yes gene_type:complete
MALTQVSTGGLKDGTILNADINASAAIAGTKINPDFGSQDITTSGEIEITGTTTVLKFTENDNNPDFGFLGNGGLLRIQDLTNTSNIIVFGPNNVQCVKNLDLDNGLDVTGAITGTGNLTIDTNTLHVDSSNNRVGIGTTSPEDLLHIKSGKIRIENTIVSNNDSTISYDNTDFIIDVDPNNARGSSKFQVKVDTVAGLTVDDNRNVGIGTSSPDTLLDVSSSDDAVIRIQSEGTDATDDARLEVKTTNGTFTMQNDRSLGTSGALTFAGNTSNNLVIDHAGGNVGIGTASPAVKFVVSNGGAEGLEISHSSGTVDLNAYNRSTSARSPVGIVGQTFTVATGNPSLNTGLFQNSSGNVGIGTTSLSEKLTLNGNLLLEGGSNHAYPFIRLHSSAANVRKWTIYNGQPWNPDALIFYDTDEDNTTLTIETNKLGVNKGANSLTRNFEVGGTALITGNLEVSSGQITCGTHGTIGMQIINNGIFGTLHSANLTLRTVSTQRMVIDTNGNVGAPSGSNIYNASDIRLKKNITTLDKGLEAVKSLRPVSFNWIDGFCDDEKETLYGFIAQEVETVDSNLVQKFGNSSVTVEKQTIDSVLRVNEKFIIPMLVKAIQELTARVEALKTEVATLNPS